MSFLTMIPSENIFFLGIWFDSPLSPFSSIDELKPEEAFNKFSKV